MKPLGGSDLPDRDPAATLGVGFALAWLASTVWPQGAFPVEGLAVAAGAAVLALLAIAAWTIAPSRGGVAASIVVLPWLAAWAVAWARSPVPFLGRPEVATAFQGGLFFVGLCFARAASRDPARFLVGAAWTLAALGGFHALYAIYHLAGPEGWPRTAATLGAAIRELDLPDHQAEGLLHAVGEGRALGFFGSPNMLAGLLAPSLAAALALALLAKGRPRVAALALAIMAMAALWLTGSRGGVLGAAAGVLVVAGLVGCDWQRARRIGGTAAAMLLAVVAAGCDSARWMGVTTVQQRLSYWEAAWSIWKSNGLLLGGGAGAFEVHYPAVRAFGANETVYAHSLLFQWGASAGLLALSAFAAIALAAAIGLATAMKGEQPNGRIGAAALAGGMAAMLAHGLVDFTLSWRELHLLFFGLAGVAAGGIPHGKAIDARAVASCAAALVVAATVALWPLQARPAFADRAAEEARLLAGEGELDAALDSYARAIRLEPDNARWLEARGLVRLAAGDARGSDDLRRALLRHPQSARLREQIARHEFQRGGRSLDGFRDAVAAHPASVARRLALVEHAILLGDLEGAESEIAVLRGEPFLFTAGERLRLEELASEARGLKD